MKVDPQKVARLGWIAEVMQFDAWQKFWGALEKDAAEMQQEAMKIGPQPTIRQKNLLDLVGLEPPQSTEDKMNIFLTFRGVANYITSKQNQLAMTRSVYEHGMRELKAQDELQTEPQVTLKSEK